MPCLGGQSPRGWVPAGSLVGAENYVTSCDLGIFVDQAAESVPPEHADACAFRQGIGSPRRRILLQRPVRPVGVVVIGVLAGDEPQMPFTSDQHSVQAFAVGAADPAFGDRVGPRRRLHPI
jgi:hypothetical protein